MRFVSVFGIVIITALVYGRAVFTNDFVEWDDGLLILENPIAHGFSWGNIKEAFTSYDPELYIPLTFLSYQLDYSIWGLNPVGFHLTNLLLHIGNSILIFLFFMSITRYSNILKNVGIYGALIAAGLFALHPLHTEAIVWASARKDLLSAFFFLLSLNLYCSDKKRWSIGTFVLACMVKVTAVMFPFVLLLVDWRNFPSRREGIEGRGSDWKLVLEKLPYFLISLLFIIIALFGKAGSHGLWWEKVLIGTKATMFYLQKLFWPSGLSVLYPHTQPITIANPDLLVPFLLVIFLTGFAIYSVKWSKEPAFGWLFFLLLLLPSFTNFAKGQDVLKDVYFASDRYAYLASIGIMYIVCLAIFSWRAVIPGRGEFVHMWLRPRMGALIMKRMGALIMKRMGALILKRMGALFGFLGFVGFIGFLGFLSYNQSLVWNNTKTLFTNVVQHYPNSHVANNNLGSLLYREGEIDSAIAKYKESLAVRPNATAFFNLGVIYEENGYPDIAREAFTQALKQNPNDGEARRHLEALGI